MEWHRLAFRWTHKIRRAIGRLNETAPLPAIIHQTPRLDDAEFKRVNKNSIVRHLARLMLTDFLGANSPLVVVCVQRIVRVDRSTLANERTHCDRPSMSFDDHERAWMREAFRRIIEEKQYLETFQPIIILLRVSMSTDSWRGGGLRPASAVQRSQSIVY